ncbi:MAG: hypothetical protein PHQ12_14210, partial [Chthoniobacteraceae bacterium]|nr:hypothetical protein [Chthoniobacteraceae bacterium]
QKGRHMPFERVAFREDLFARKGENDAEWLIKSHEGEKPIATCCMELTGESSPVAVCDAAELGKLSLQHPLVYQYSWNIGLTGRMGLNWLDLLDEDEALLVQLILYGGQSRFVSREVFATLEYLPPTRNLKETPSFLEWGKILLTHSASLSGNVGALLQPNNPPAGIGLQCAGAIAATIGNMIPSDDQGYSKWFLYKFDIPLDTNAGGYVYGVEWHISRAVIKEVGTRLSGKLGVVFLDAPFQTENAANESLPIHIQGKLGLQPKPEHGKWWGFSLVPLRDNGPKLKVSPRLVKDQ